MSDQELTFTVRDAEGVEQLRDSNLSKCRFKADELGVGASIEIIGEVIYTVSKESLTDPDYDLFND